MVGQEASHDVLWWPSLPVGPKWLPLVLDENKTGAAPQNYVFWLWKERADVPGSMKVCGNKLVAVLV